MAIILTLSPTTSSTISLKITTRSGPAVPGRLVPAAGQCLLQKTWGKGFGFGLGVGRLVAEFGVYVRALN